MMILDETTAAMGSSSASSSQKCEVEVFGARQKKRSPIKLPASASLWKDTWWTDGDELMRSPLDLLRIKYDDEFVATSTSSSNTSNSTADYMKIFNLANITIDQNLEEQVLKKQREMSDLLGENFLVHVGDNLNFEDRSALRISMRFLKHILKEKFSKTDQKWSLIHCRCMSYLQRLQSIFEMCLGQPPAKPDEQTFTSLFCAFTEIAIGYVMPSGGCMQRSLRVCGNDVKPIPDLRMLKVEDDLKEKGCFEISVVTVAEVKKRPVRTVKDEEEQSDAAGDNVIKRRRLDELKYKFPSGLRGQHAAKLLVELPFSAVDEHNDNKFIFDLIIQATKVSLTCLKMKKLHLQELREETSPSEVSCSHSANIFYTRPYDMLCAEDRNHLVYILTILARVAGRI